MGIEQIRDRIRENFPKADSPLTVKVPRAMVEELKLQFARRIWKQRNEFTPKELWNGPIKKRWYEWFNETFGEDVEEFAKRAASARHNDTGNP